MPQGTLQGQVHGPRIHEAVQGEGATDDGGKGKADCTEEPVHRVGEGDVDGPQEGHVLHP